MYPAEDVYRKETSDDQELQMLASAGWFPFIRRLIASVGRGKAAIGFNVLLIVTFPMAFSDAVESTHLASVLLEPTTIRSVDLTEPAVELVDHQIAEALEVVPLSQVHVGIVVPFSFRMSFAGDGKRLGRFTPMTMASCSRSLNSSDASIINTD